MVNNGLKEITRFNGRWHFLSNFYATPVPYMGVTWKTSEHAFQAAKLTGGDFERIQKIPSAGHAKIFARSCPKPLDWDDRKVQVMREVLLSKFTASQQLRTWLMETGEARLIEGNTWGDKYWGAVLFRGGWLGENMLGKLLMELRVDLRIAALDPEEA